MTEEPFEESDAEGDRVILDDVQGRLDTPLDGVQPEDVREYPGAVVHLGDCLDVLRAMPDESVDTVVTDPPYGLSNIKPEQITEAITAWAAGDRERVPGGHGFMGKAWDSFVPPPAVWDECLRVLKPGGHLVAFSGSRTHDMMGLSIRMAGFEIRDGLAWLYGSGFPKSLDVSKAIDKAGGVSPATSAMVLRSARQRAGLSRDEVAASVGCTASSVRDWEEGRARTAGGAVEYVTPSPLFREKLACLLGYTTDERRINREGGGPRGLYNTGHRGIAYADTPTTSEAERWQGWGTALKPAFEPITLARKPLEGTVAANVLKWGTGALNIDGCRVAHRDEADLAESAGKNRHADFGTKAGGNKVYGDYSMVERTNYDGTKGRWPANVVLDDSQADVLGDPSRFFYCAKANNKERPVVDGVRHPTVKPLALMRWLVRLVTPPGGVVLDPFAGSGSTLEAAVLEGFDVVGVEREPRYLPLIEQRLKRSTVDHFRDVTTKSNENDRNHNHTLHHEQVLQCQNFTQ